MKNSKKDDFVAGVCIVVLAYFLVNVFCNSKYVNDIRFINKKAEVSDNVSAEHIYILDEYQCEGSDTYKAINRKTLYRIVVTGFVTCGLALIYLIIEFLSVEVYSHGITRRKIGRMLVFKMGNSFYGFLSEHIKEKSETGWIEIWFADEFVRKNMNKAIIIKMGKANSCEIIKQHLYIKCELD